VTLPLAIPGVIAGSIFTFSLTLGDYITSGQQTTLPIWMLTELVRPRQRPVTNVVAVFVIVVTFIPLVATQILTQRSEQGRS
jgi:putative spermidine/putrescine transport system permease protein